VFIRCGAVETFPAPPQSVDAAAPRKFPAFAPCQLLT
jgi:hypothetical protein